MSEGHGGAVPDRVQSEGRGEGGGHLWRLAEILRSMSMATSITQDYYCTWQYLKFNKKSKEIHNSSAKQARIILLYIFQRKAIEHYMATAGNSCQGEWNVVSSGLVLLVLVYRDFVQPKSMNKRAHEHLQAYPVEITVF